MNLDTLRQVARIGDDYLQGHITGIILNFHGLGDPGLKPVPSYEENEWAASGGLVVMPYPGPWNWMNRQTRSFVDEVVDAVYENYHLSREVPLILNGGSMGGYGSLLYARYSRHPFVACQALYPVCDLEYHFSERPDLPRTIHFCFRGYEEDYASLFREHSPLHQVAEMPRVPYQIIQGDADHAVNKAAHADKMVAAMRAHGHDINYIEVPGMGHSAPARFDVYRAYIDFVKRFLN